MIRIDSDISIDEKELEYVASRSAGPGGQNVNKVATRITLRFDLEASPVLDEDQKALVRERLATRINKEGILRVTSQRHRTQAANREAATERFAELLRGALEVRRARRPTRTPRGVDRRRLETKRRRSQVKRDRSRKYRHEE